MRGSEFAELKAFVAIIEHGSFKRAAAHLGMSASALSQTLKAFEERLGSRLINRTTRSVALTEIGSRLLETAGPALLALETAVDQASATDDVIAGRLRINSTRDAAIYYLAPLLTPFLLSNPGVALEIVCEERLIDIVGQGFDAGIRLGECLQQDMVAIKLSGPMEMKVVAAPTYLQRFGIPQSPQDLQNHQCLAYRRPTDGSVYRWEFEKEGEKLEVSVNGPALVADPTVLTQAALDGLGIAYVFSHHVQPHLEAGRLVQMLADWTPAFPGFYIYYPSQRLLAAPLKAFVQFISTRTTHRPYDSSAC